MFASRHKLLARKKNFVQSISMKLATYLVEKHISQTDFAQQIGRNPSTVHRLLKGAKPDADTLARIIAATKGKVALEDFVELEPVRAA